MAVSPPLAGVQRRDSVNGGEIGPPPYPFLTSVASSFWLGSFALRALEIA